MTYEDLPCPDRDPKGPHSMETVRDGTRNGEPVMVLQCRYCKRSSGDLYRESNQ